MPVPRAARRHVHPNLQGQFEQFVATREYMQALSLVSSEHCMPTLRSLWRSVPKAYQAAALGDAISGGDLMRPHLVFLVKALRKLHARGERVFDPPSARQAFEALPEQVTAYRGTVQAEVDDQPYIGVCWTLKRDAAVFFATTHGRFRNTASPPVLLTTTVPRDAICGLLTGREEDEVLLDAARLAFTVERLPPSRHRARRTLAGALQ
jgi:hypothetical protein